MKTITKPFILALIAVLGYSCCPRPSFEGCYITRWKDSTGVYNPVSSPMYIKVRGDQVTGAWGVEGNSGQLHGTLSGNGYELTGVWATPSFNSPSYQGNIWFTLSATGDRFDGTWNGGTPRGVVQTRMEWSGRRVDCDSIPEYNYLKTITEP